MRVDELERELRAQRPETDRPSPRRLDEWAEAGFPRDRGLGPGSARAPARCAALGPVHRHPAAADRAAGRGGRDRRA